MYYGPVIRSHLLPAGVESSFYTEQSRCHQFQYATDVLHCFRHRPPIPEGARLVHARVPGRPLRRVGLLPRALPRGVARSFDGRRRVRDDLCLAISAPRPWFRLKLGHDLREIHSTDWSEQHLAQTSRDPELKHKLTLISTQAGTTTLRRTCIIASN